MDYDDLLLYIDKIKMLYTRQKHTNEWMDGADTAINAVEAWCCARIKEEEAEDEEGITPELAAVIDRATAADDD
jgi:hypothetical protein